MQRKAIGVFGGTFNPIHFGHLRMALELKQCLSLHEMRLMPAHKPPHRDEPVIASHDRAKMVELAIEDCEDLTLDTRELLRDSPSYTYETLRDLREECGDQTALCFAVGMDSLVNLHTWYRWKDILQLAHIIVAARPGWDMPVDGPVFDIVKKYQTEPGQLLETSAGSIVIQQLTLLPVSSTAIRQLILRGESPQYLLPDKVWQYIADNRLYRK